MAKKSDLVDKVGTTIEEGDIIAYAVTHYQSAMLRLGTVVGFTEKSIRVEVPDKYNDWVDGKSVEKVELKKMSVSKEKTDNVIVVTKKVELENIKVR